jgi:hypothetical protein
MSDLWAWSSHYIDIHTVDPKQFLLHTKLAKYVQFRSVTM